MKLRKILILVHGTQNGVEATRAELFCNACPDLDIRCHFREHTRQVTRRNWIAAIRQFRPDLLYVINTALPGVPLALSTRLVSGLPYIIDTGDAVHAMARSAGTGNPVSRGILFLAESMIQKYAHGIVVRGSFHLDYLKRQGLKHLYLIRDSYVPRIQDSVEEKDVEKKAVQIGIHNRFVVGLMGSLTYSSRLQYGYGWELVHAMANLKDLPITGLIIGDGPGRKSIEDLAERRGVRDRILFLGRIPKEEIDLHLRLLDIALSTQTNNLAGQVRTTGKLPEYMASERFILASRVGEAAKLLPDSMLVTFDGEVDSEYPNRLAERLRHLFHHRQILEDRHLLKSIVEEHCSPGALQRAFYAFCREISRNES